MKQPNLKYCGNHSLSDLLLVSNSQADYIGFVFAESKRQVNPDDVAEWLGILSTQKIIADSQKQNRPKFVGVFVNPTIAELKDVLTKLPLDVIQCHGSETPDEILEIKEQVNIQVWKAIHHDDQSLDLMHSFGGIADGYVIDCKTDSEWGGTGKSFDWSVIPWYLAEAERQNRPCFIAGGISPDNITRLLNYDPDGIDLASGIEEYGEKSMHLINALEKKVGEAYDKNIS